jgi:prepilin-type N-terminal cleavage/methylation domain-containing protein
MTRPRRQQLSVALRRGPRRGFTLVELMVAIVLITVGLLGSAALMATSLRYQRGAASREEMLALAEAKLDELRSYQNAPAGSGLKVRLAVGGSLTSSVANYYDEVNGPSLKPYRRRWQITQGTVRTRDVQIRVEPRYTDRYAAWRVDLRTLIQLY